MKKMTVITAFMSLALVFGSATKSEAFCLFGCSDVEVDTEVNTMAGNDIDDSAVAQGDRNSVSSNVVKNVRNSVVITGDVNTRQSNYIGGVGVSRGDITQSNSANITGKQDTNIQNNNMSTFRGFGENSN
ncbi:hypothetical protein MNBD_NITROSPIRAE01-2053 [hydrothermal vent metagenome]|uniref:Uncharacterized protein n=1 Tax=hydrothermal vent metagenome TaxID=652676 RepID=A0A3B1CT63_9ZZZZ